MGALREMPFGESIATIDPSFFGDWSHYRSPGTSVERNAQGQVTRVSRYGGSRVSLEAAGSSQSIRNQVHTAAEANDIETLERLAAADTSCLSASDPSRRGRTPLHSAALGGALAALELLLSKGVNVNAKAAGGGTPLHYAARYGMKEAAAMLLQAGADPMARDKSGDTPLEDAVKRRHTEIASEIRFHMEFPRKDTLDVDHKESVLGGLAKDILKGKALAEMRHKEADERIKDKTEKPALVAAKIEKAEQEMQAKADAHNKRFAAKARPEEDELLQAQRRAWWSHHVGDSSEICFSDRGGTGTLGTQHGGGCGGEPFFDPSWHEVLIVRSDGSLTWSESGVTGSSWGSSSYSETANGWWELPSLPDVNVVTLTAQEALDVVNLVYPDVESEISCWWEEIEGGRGNRLWGKRVVPQVSSLNATSKIVKVRRMLRRRLK